MNAIDTAKLVSFLVACGRDQWLNLPGVGWLTVKRYKGVGGDRRTSDVAADKVLPFFDADPELHRALNGLPPSGKSFPDEVARYVDALHPDLDGSSVDSTQEGSFTVERFPWAEAISDEIRRAIVAHRRAEVPELGTFEVVDEPDRRGVDGGAGEDTRSASQRRVRFRPSKALKARLSEVS